jgi:hypothetical protein
MPAGGLVAPERAVALAAFDQRFEHREKGLVAAVQLVLSAVACSLRRARGSVRVLATPR